MYVLLGPASGLLCFSSEEEEQVSWVLEALEVCDDVVGLILQELWAAYLKCMEEETNDHAFFRLPVVG